MLSGDKISASVSGAVDKDRQETENGFELTVDEVYCYEEPASLDFGGKEENEAPIRLQEKNRTSSAIFSITAEEGDEHCWWNLTGGIYLFEYNEILGELGHGHGFVEPTHDLGRSGVYHPLYVGNKLPTVPVQVGGHGLRLKENTQVSTLRVHER